jgi:hypothetical protein
MICDPTNVIQNKQTYPIQPDVLQQLIALNIGQNSNIDKFTTCSAILFKNERYNSMLVSRGKRCLVQFEFPSDTR